MLIESDYKGHRIEVYAHGLQGEWDAVARIRRLFSEDKPHVETVVSQNNGRARGEAGANLGEAVGRPQGNVMPFLLPWLCVHLLIRSRNSDAD